MAAVVGLFATGTVGSVDIGTVAAAPVQIRPLAVFNAPVNGDLALLSDDGSTAVVLQEDAGQFEMIAVDVASGTTRSLGTGNFWGMKSLSTDGSRVLVRLDFAPGRATILDTTDGTVTWQSAPGVDVYDAVMSDDASTVALSVLLPSGAIHVVDVDVASGVGTDLTPSTPGYAIASQVSDDGSTIALYTDDPSLVGTDRVPVLWQRATGAFSPGIVTVDGAPPTDFAIYGISLSGDGRYVAVSTGATNLAGAVAGRVPAYRYDTVTGEVLVVSSGWNGVPVDAGVMDIADDGSSVLLVATPSQAEGEPSSYFGSQAPQVYRYDIALDRLELVSASIAGTPGDGFSSGARMDGDGSTVAFMTRSPNFGADPARAVPMIAELEGPQAGSAAPYVGGDPDRPAIGGWFDGPVTVTWSARLRNGTSVAAPAPTVVSAEGLTVATSDPVCNGVDCAAGRLAVAIDTTPPSWRSVGYPSEFGGMVRAEISDAGSGVDVSSIRLTVDGSPCNPLDRRGDCRLDPVQQDGVVHVVSSSSRVEVIAANDLVGHPLVVSPPAAPSALAVAPLTDGVTVDVFMPTFDASVTSYEARCTSLVGPPGGSTNTSSQVLVPGLQPGATYTCEARAVNSAGPGPWSAPSAPIVLPTRPTEPTILAAVVSEPRRVQVTFDPPRAQGASPVTAYRSTCASSDGGTARTVNTSASPALVTNLTAGASYTCTVTARNAQGFGSVSAPSPSFVVPAVPAAPSITSAVPSLRQASIEFVSNGDGGAAIGSYRVSCVSSTGGVTRQATGTTSPLVVGALTVGATYACTMTATNSSGTSPASAPSTAWTVPDVPGAPAVVSVSRLAPRQVSVAFGPPTSDGGAAIVRYRASCTSTNGGTARHVNAAASPITVGGLTLNSTYRCTVTATNGIGTGPASAPSAPFVAV